MLLEYCVASARYLFIVVKVVRVCIFLSSPSRVVVAFLADFLLEILLTHLVFLSFLFFLPLPLSFSRFLAFPRHSHACFLLL